MLLATILNGIWQGRMYCLFGIKKKRKEMLEQYAGSNAEWDFDNSKLRDSQQLESKILGNINRIMLEYWKRLLMSFKTT